MVLLRVLRVLTQLSTTAIFGNSNFSVSSKWEIRLGVVTSGMETKVDFSKFYVPQNEI